MTQNANDRADETYAGRHRAPETGLSTSERNSGVPQTWRPAHTARHAAQETHPLSDRPPA